MSRVVKFAAMQLTKTWDLEANLEKIKGAIREAAARPGGGRRQHTAVICPVARRPCHRHQIPTPTH